MEASDDSNIYINTTRKMPMIDKVKNTLALFVLAPMILLIGCSTLKDAKSDRGTGQKVTYNASFEQIWAELPGAIERAGLDFVSANKDDRSILAQRGMTAFSYGENVAVFVNPINKNTTQTEVVSKKTMATNVFAPNWAKPIFEELDKKFKRVN